MLVPQDVFPDCVQHCHPHSALPSATRLFDLLVVSVFNTRLGVEKGVLYGRSKIRSGDGALAKEYLEEGELARRIEERS